MEIFQFIAQSPKPKSDKGHVELHFYINFLNTPLYIIQCNTTEYHTTLRKL